MKFTNVLQKATPILVLFVVILGALNVGSYNPHNELTVLTPESAQAQTLFSPPTLSTPTLSFPEFSTPTLTTSSLTVPTLTVPVLTIPNHIVPTLSIPTLNSNAITVQTCEVNANLQTVYAGSSVTISWSTTGFATATLNGEAVNAAAGSRTFTNIQADTTYTLVALTADGESSCISTVKVLCVLPPVYSVPSCDAFTVAPTSVRRGETANLTWATTNASRIVINNGIGEVGAMGTFSITPLATTTYLLTAYGVDNQQDTCEVTIGVQESPVVQQPLTCAANVNLSANPNLINRGDSSTLTWTTTGVTAVTFDSGITATGLSGSTSVSPTNSTTYTLTATNGRETINCPIPVTVRTGGGGGGGGGSASPRCELSISDNKINRGDDVVITWESTLATDITLEDQTEDEVLVTTSGLLSSAKERLLDGRITVSPEKDTTYVLTVKRGSTLRKCTVDVELNDNIVVTEVRNQPLVAGIALTAVPHTGFEAGPILTLLFYILLMAWALYIAYLLVIKRDIIGGLVLAGGVQAPSTPRLAPEQVRPDVFVASVKAPEMPASTLPTNLPTGTPAIGYVNHVEEVVEVAEVASHQIDDVEMTQIENHAHAQQVLLSSDAIRHFIATTNTQTERTIALDQVIVAAKAQFPAEDGWVVLNEKRMQDLCLICAVNAQKVDTTPYIPAVIPQGAGSLAEAIVTGNVVAAYELIGNRPMFALADAAADLDAVYRIRRGIEAKASELLMKETAMLTNEQILKTIEALTGALDGTYNDEASAVKVAIMKAIKVVAQ